MPARRQPAAPARQRVRRGNAEDAEQLRRDLMRAAVDLVAEKGVAALSIRAVAARVGVSPMATYRYFADKSDLLGGIWNQALRSLLAEYRTMLAKTEGVRQRQRGMVETFIRFWQKRPDYYALLYGFSEVGATNIDDRPGLADLPVYGELRALQESLMRELADEIGADLRHMRSAHDVRLAMSLGFLHGTMVVTRYGWSDPEPLLQRYIDCVVLAVEQCLLGGPAADGRPLLARVRQAKAAAASHA